MSLTLTPLDKQKHRLLKLKGKPDFSGVVQHNLVPLHAFEFYYASNNFPIFFVKDQQTAEFRCAGLCGFASEENIVFTIDKIASTYIPIAISLKPFYCIDDPQQKHTTLICIDENSSRLDEAEGERLFNENGQPSNILESIVKQLRELEPRQRATERFIATLLEHQLLEPAELDINLGKGCKTRLMGLYQVSRKKLEELPDHTIAALFRSGELAAIFAHINSCGQIPRLLDLRTNLFRPEN